MTDNKLIELVNNKGYSLSKDEDDFEIIKGNVENWLAFGPEDITLGQAVANTLAYKDPWKD